MWKTGRELVLSPLRKKSPVNLTLFNLGNQSPGGCILLPSRILPALRQEI
jgi:hypothetical protein